MATKFKYPQELQPSGPQQDHGKNMQTIQMMHVADGDVDGKRSSDSKTPIPWRGLPGA